MEICSLCRSSLIDELQKVYQLTNRYEQTCQKVYRLQQEMIPAEEPKLIQELKGRFGGGFGLIIFLISTLLIGLQFLWVFEVILINLGWENGLTRFLFGLSVMILTILGVTVPIKNFINKVIGRLNVKRIENTCLQNERNTIYNQQIEEEMKPLLQSMQVMQAQYRALDVNIPQRYSTASTLNRILTLLKDGRTDSWSGAVNLYEEEISRQKMEEKLRAIQNNQKRVIDQNEAMMHMHNQMMANQQFTNIMVAWNLSNMLMR